MNVNKASRLSVKLISGILFSLLFTLANPSGIAHAQVRRVLIVEHVARQEKPKVYWPGDFVLLSLKAEEKVLSGKITAFSDSSIFFRNTEVLISDIDYFTQEINGRMVLKFLGVVGAGIGTATILVGIIGLSSTAIWGYSTEDPTFVLAAATVVPATALSYYAATRKASRKKWGPETGWRFRMKTIGQG